MNELDLPLLATHIFHFYKEDWKAPVAELTAHHGTLLQSGNSKTRIAENSRKITFPFCSGMKNDFSILDRTLVCMWKRAGDEGGRRGKKRGRRYK